MMPLILSEDDRGLDEALSALLETGGVFVFPTDTVYGMGGNPWDERAVARVRKLKERPFEQPFALLACSIESVSSIAAIDFSVAAILGEILPGPYTLLLPAGSKAPASAVKDGKIGIRVPDHRFFSGAMLRLGQMLFGTSVNRTGESPLNTVEEIVEGFPGVDLIVEGKGVRGRPSAVIDLTVNPPEAIRGVLPEQLRQDSS